MAAIGIPKAITVAAVLATLATTAAAHPRVRQQTGLASWYGRWHHGRTTASGERFDMNALTAAHPTLPLGTRIRVTNLENGRSVDVRINDRGPTIPSRILDLSRAAALRIGALAAGVVRVRLTVLEPTEGPRVARAHEHDIAVRRASHTRGPPRVASRARDGARAIGGRHVRRASSVRH